MPFCDCIGKPDSFDLDILDCTHVIAMLKSLTIWNLIYQLHRVKWMEYYHEQVDQITEGILREYSFSENTLLMTNYLVFFEYK